MGSKMLHVCVCLPAGLCVFGRLSFHRECYADLGKLKISSPWYFGPPFSFCLSVSSYSTQIPSQDRQSTPLVKKRLNELMDPESAAKILFTWMLWNDVIKTDKTGLGFLDQEENSQ